jgi:hypothetical protein
VDDPEGLYPSLLRALRAWHKPNRSSAEQLTDLLVVQDYRRRILLQDPAISPNEATDRFLSSLVDALSSRDREGAAILRARFDRGQAVGEVAQNVHLSVDAVHRRQRKAIKEIERALARQEQTMRDDRALLLEIGLQPPTYTRLFGADRDIQVLTERLLSGQPPWLALIAGLGGIGKTAVADQLVRQIVRRFHFKHVIWFRYEPPGISGRDRPASAPYEQLVDALGRQPHIEATGLPQEQQAARVGEILKRKPHLVIIDNLETADEVNVLFQRLPAYGGPSHFLLTSRAHPHGVFPAYVHSLSELNLEDSLALLRYEASVQNVSQVAEAVPGRLEEVHHLIGGNPLALKLTVGLARVMPLRAILDELSRSWPGPTESMYRHIYWRSWQALSQEARELLTAMLLVAESGGRPSQLVAASGLSEQSLWPAVRELAGLSLLETRGSLEERRYGIHRLTATFLQTEIVRLPPV